MCESLEVYIGAKTSDNPSPPHPSDKQVKFVVEGGTDMAILGVEYKFIF